MLSSLLIIVSCLLALPAARAYFEGCDNAYALEKGRSFFESPRYPNNYPAGTSCRYQLTAPLDHYIAIQCSINLPTNNGQCTTDNFWIDTEGDLLMRGSENFCGRGLINRQSLFTELTFAYISTARNTGQFKCTVDVIPQNCDCGWSVSPRISNGRNAAPNEYPSMVALKDITSNVDSFCGGVVASHRYILTAAHCTLLVRQATQILAIAGTNNLKNPASSKYFAQYPIQQMIRHESYQNNPNPVNDIAILITASNIKWTRGVGPICLPPVGTTYDFAQDLVDIIGFGTVYFAGPTANMLQKITLMVTKNQYCQTEYQGSAIINPNQVCTYDYAGLKQDSCQHDSGGPVISRRYKHFLVGIISFGKTCAAAPYSMGINTRISTYMNWIRGKIGNSYCPVALK